MGKVPSVDPTQFESQVTELIAKYKETKQENILLKIQIVQYQEEMRRLEARVESLQADYERLKLARAFGWNEASKRQANDRLSKLVRDIDRCLTLLNE